MRRAAGPAIARRTGQRSSSVASARGRGQARAVLAFGPTLHRSQRDAGVRAKATVRSVGLAGSVLFAMVVVHSA